MAEIIWTPDALDDLYRIELDAARYSRSYSTRVVDRIYDAVASLSDFPEMGRWVPGFRSPDIRQIIVRNHLVTYRLFRDEVRIIAVTGGSQAVRESDFQ
jgi:plasmid stabilization system protein ParE